MSALGFMRDTRAIFVFALFGLLVLSPSGAYASELGTGHAADGSTPGVGDLSPSVPSAAAAADLDACEGGDMSRCYTLGVRFHGGDGVTRDNRHAVVLVQSACDGGYAPACYDLGVRHLLGEYVVEDAGQALARIVQSCDGSYPVACYFAATLVRDGIGVPRRLDAAHQLFERACELEYEDACVEIEAGLVAREGGEESRLGADAPESVRRAARMCDGGRMSGCARLADAYDTNGALAVDIDHAIELRRRACDWGLLPACTALGDAR